MTASVPAIRHGVDLSGLVAGRTVRAHSWRSLAHLQNWVLGHGCHVVPAYVPDVSLSASTTYTFRYYFKPHYQATSRLWTFMGETTSYVSRVTLTGDGAAATVTASPNRLSLVPQWYVDQVTQSQTGGEWTLQVQPLDYAVRVYQLGCVDLPRLVLSTSGNDNGLDLARFTPGRPIDMNAVQNLQDVTANITYYARRASYLQWAVPDTTAFARSDTNTSWGTARYVLGGTAAVYAPTHARKRYSSSTTATLSARIYCWEPGGGTINARLVTASGNTGASVAVTSATGAWSDEMTVTIDCEDLSVSDGRRGSAWEGVDVQIYTTSGTWYCSSLSAWED